MTRSLTREQEIDALVAALDLEGVIETMRDEGLGYGEDLRADLFPGAGEAGWAAKVATIYDADRMRAGFLGSLAKELPADGLDAMIGFFGSDRGQRIIGLELSARNALLDDAVEEASNQMRDQMLAEDGPRLAQLRRFVEVNDLIELNVAGAMNANYAFYRGLVDGGAFAEEMTEEQIVTDVWSQEENLRKETEDWLFSYLGMAYQPLSDEDLEAYIGFSQTAEGKALNLALFRAFDGMFTAMSRELGVAAAGFVAGQDI